MGTYQIRTKKQYDFFEVASALQKAIRRSNEDDALYWATELIESGKSKYLWKRLLVMTVEDIGLAAPNLPQRMWSLYQMYGWAVKNNVREKNLYIYQALLMMVRVPKSRLVDWVNGYATDGHYLRNKEIPDYALDIHTRRGKSMGKTINDFFDEGSLLIPQKEIQGEEEYKNHCRKLWTKQSESDRKVAKAKFDDWSPDDCDHLRPPTLFEQD